jgi:hypothetical protein
MRFRLIEKDMGGMANVGLKDQHMQGKEDDVTTSDSKTYIGSKGKQKLAMNKIKNTKIGDDIHYYINGQEGRGIVIKMANEYIEIFKEDGQLGTIHINDTFFVKDILINKQWDDMDDTERYEALIKIHAPSPRYITKTWFDMPEEIKELLRKEGGNMAGGTGSTYEKGESKDSETQDHSRTGFAQNEQYSSKKPKGCKCGDPECKDPKCKKHTSKADNPEQKDQDKARNEESEKDDTKRDWAEHHKSEAFRKLKPVYEGDTKEAKKAWEVWLERQEKSHENPSHNPSRGKRKREPLLEADKADDNPTGINGRYMVNGKHVGDIKDFNKKQWYGHVTLHVFGPDMAEYGALDQGAEVHTEDGEIHKAPHPERGSLLSEKSDVEHGRYGSVGGAPDVAVSTDTKVDVTEGTGYEERPHISVEEAGKLPRSTFNDSGSELTVSGSQDSKDEPKFSQPVNQEQPVRKAGLPQQHPNTYGMRYGMKGGVKKVWCPEHQMWEETTKDWHEE